MSRKRLYFASFLDVIKHGFSTLLKKPRVRGLNFSICKFLLNIFVPFLFSILYSYYLFNHSNNSKVIDGSLSSNYISVLSILTGFLFNSMVFLFDFSRKPTMIDSYSFVELKKVFFSIIFSIVISCISIVLLLLQYFVSGLLLWFLFCLSIFFLILFFISFYYLVISFIFMFNERRIE